jgi:hypothetical protein
VTAYSSSISHRCHPRVGVLRVVSEASFSAFFLLRDPMTRRISRDWNVTSPVGGEPSTQTGGRWAFSVLPDSL